jgi:hypothetical protein
MHAKFLRHLGLCALLALNSCSLFQREKPPEPTASAAEKPVLVGRIASIPADKRFVLIQSYGSWNVPTGRILTSRGPDERSANLLVTGEKLGQFAAADLQSGTVGIGDGVYALPESSGGAPVPESEAIENQNETESGENVQKNS